jgi:hypothetical protein
MSDYVPPTPAYGGGARAPLLPNASVGNPASSAPPIDPAARPVLEQELGTQFDYTAGDLVFTYQPGLPANVGLVYDYREPTVNQLQEMLDNDGKARSLEQVLSMPIIGAGWRVTPGEGNNDHKTAQWVEDILRRDTPNGGMQGSIEYTIAQMTSAFVMRRSYHEKVFKQDDKGQIVYDKIAYRPTDTCTMLRDKRTGDLMGFNQWVFGKPIQVSVVLPYAHVYVHGQHRNPVKGISDLQVAYRNYRTKEKLRFLWYTYCEVMSLPRTIVLANSDSAAKKAASTIAALKNAGVAGIPKEWVSEIMPLPFNTNSAHSFQEAIGYLDSESALSLLAGFTDLPSRAMGTAATMGGGSRGSYGLSESQIAFFMTMMRAYAGELGASVTDGIVKDLVRWNKGIDTQIPRFEVGPMEAQDITQSFQMLQALASAPNVQVPIEFIQQLTLDISDQLGFNTDAIERGFKDFKPLPAQQQITQITEQGAQVAQRAQKQLRNQGQPSPKIPQQPVQPGGRRRTPVGAQKPANTAQPQRPSPARSRARSAVSGRTQPRTTSS